MAATTRNDELHLESLRGGFNDTDPPNALQDDECTTAENVEWYYSTLGERRQGAVALDITGSGVTGENRIVHISQRFPANDLTDPELWLIGGTVSTTTTWARRTAGIWSNPVPKDALVNTEPDIYNVQAQPLHGKMFFAYKSAVDRLHVWDGSHLRRAGITAPTAAPTAVDTGAAGTFSGIRYYRVRFIELSGTKILRRSEPSAVLTFTPSGTKTGAVVTEPALVNENETHWELEASVDNANFYIIATTVVGTTTFTDTQLYSLGYADLGELSENVGTYDLIPSVRFLASDEDRLLMGGDQSDPDKASRVYWTPVFNDPGKGNDERLPLQVNDYEDLNNYEGGGLTGITNSVNGSWYAFKWSQIYRMTRTGNRQRAYESVVISKARGAVPGSIVEGMDESGRGVIYFLDPTLGPSRIGSSGLQSIYGVRRTWKRVNLKATKIVSRAVYYPDHQQVWWWVAIDGADTPNYMLKIQVTELQDGPRGMHRGISIATGQITSAYCAAIVNEMVTDGSGTATLAMRPYIGMATPYFVQRGDVGGDDGGIAYRAVLRSKPFFPVGLLNQWGAMKAALLATMSATATVVVKNIRNFMPNDNPENQITTTLTGDTNQEFVIKQFDDLRMSESVGIQFEFSDPE